MPKATLVLRINPGEGSSRQYNARKTFDFPQIVTEPGTVYDPEEPGILFKLEFAYVTQSEVQLWSTVIDWPGDPDAMSEFAGLRSALEGSGWAFDK